MDNVCTTIEQVFCWLVQIGSYFGTWVASDLQEWDLDWKKRGMMTSSIRYKDQLEGISNYLQWKVRIAAVLKENKLWHFVSTTVVLPLSDPIALDLHEVKEATTQRILLDGVKDHLIPHLDEKQKATEMWDALKSLYENKNENGMMALKDKIHNTRMAKVENVASHLT